jgi:hypothetical protein
MTEMERLTQEAIRDAERSEVWQSAFMESLQLGRSPQSARERADEADRTAQNVLK